MANIGISEILIIAFIILLLIGTPAILVVIFLGLRRAAGTPRPPAAPGEPGEPGQTLRAAGHIHADGSLRFAGGGLQAQRVQTGVYRLVFDGFASEKLYALHATPLAEQPGEPPALIELLAGPARDHYIAAGAAPDGLYVWLRQPDQQLVDRDWMVQIVEVA